MYNKSSMSLNQVLLPPPFSTLLFNPLDTLNISRVTGQAVHNISRQDQSNFIRSIAEKHVDQPFYLMDLGEVGRLAEKWQKSLPGVRPFYAVKCNDTLALLVSLAALGANFDCASRGEIEKIVSLGVSRDRIVYSNPCKAVSHLRFAENVGVNLTTFDSIGELDKIKKSHPHCELLLRIKVKNDESSWRSLGTKFGALPEEIVPLLKHARDTGVKVVGVSFHVGSIASDSEIYRDSIAAAKSVFDAAENLNMPKMKVLNIGGGFKDNHIFDEIGLTVKTSLEEYFSGQLESLKIMAEPGRYFAETTFTLVTNVIGKRVRSNRMEYWIDDGIYGSFNLPAYDRSSMTMKPLYHRFSPPKNIHNEGSASNPTTYLTTVFGPSCDSADIVSSNCSLPELEVNDYLVFHKMGAYTRTIGTRFNGFDAFAMPTYLIHT